MSSFKCSIEDIKLSIEMTKPYFYIKASYLDQIPRELFERAHFAIIPDSYFKEGTFAYEVTEQATKEELLRSELRRNT